MTILERIQREPAALLGFATAVLGLLNLLDVFSAEVAGAVAIVVGALVALLRYVVTPSNEVVVQRVADHGAVAGPALKSVKTGEPVSLPTVLALPSAQTGEDSDVQRVGEPGPAA